MSWPSPGERSRSGLLDRFIELLPDWEEVAIGLDAIVLDSDDDRAGWYAPGVVAVCAWDHDLWDWWSPEMVAEHRPILDLLDIESVPIEDSAGYQEHIEDYKRMGVKNPGLPPDHFELRFTEAQALAYQLLHILPHELGHHHDRITTRAAAQRSRRAIRRGVCQPGDRRHLADLRRDVRNPAATPSLPDGDPDGVAATTQVFYRCGEIGLTLAGRWRG